MKKLLITGGHGQLGQALQAIQDAYPDYSFLFTDVDSLDLTNREALFSWVDEMPVDYIVNCAAYTAVDKAEEDKELCRKINRDAVKNLGEAATRCGAKVIHVSTDYVFDGTGCMPYTESYPPSPVSVYGKTKLDGEAELLAVSPQSAIIRTSWLYSEFGTNFVKTMLRLGKEREELRVIFDQVGTPTYAGDLAKAILQIIQQGEKGNFVPGIYHFSNEGVCSWYDFARKIMEMAGLECRVCPIETKDYPTPAKRPSYSVLNKSKIKETYQLAIPHWEDSLAGCLKELEKQK